MSNPHNYQSFDFPADPYHDNQSFQGPANQSFSQRPSPSPRSLSHANSRSTPGFQNGRTSDVSRVGPFLEPTQSTGAQQSSPNGSSFASYLNIPPMPRPGSLDAIRASNPITRFYFDDSQPWTPERMRAPSAPSPIGNTFRPIDFRTRAPLDSEIGSNEPGRSDSGYHSHPTHSLIDLDPELGNREMREVTNQAGNLTVRSTPTEYHRGKAESIHSHPASQTSHGKEFKCHKCKEVSKCRSDHKKHMLKHDKPWICEIPGCKRHGKGFTTINDLNRHKKSVHRINALTGSYQCASNTCRSKDKVWPRLDNFKQHVQRMHTDEDEEDLIRRSEYKPPPKTPIPSLSVAPMDTTLAGIGVERQFPGNGFDESPSGISLTPDQPGHPWSPFGMPSSHDFAIDVDQSEAALYGPGPGKVDMDTNPVTRQPEQAQTSSFRRNTGTWGPPIATRHDSARLSALATVASSQSPDGSTPQSSTALSKEPQTKAEQQKQAVHKLSQIINNIRDSSGLESVDLDIFLRMIRGAGEAESKAPCSSTQEDRKNGTSPSDSSPGSHEAATDTEATTKTDMLKSLQAFTNLVKQGGKKAIGVNNRPKPFSNSTKWCNICNAGLARACDLKKHMKRHTRPYGCTFAKCHKRFGAKSDWKRHELNQHMQLEAYRCQLKVTSESAACGEVFWRHEMFRKHLQSQHNLVPEQIEPEIKARKIGRNGQYQFWCGFCSDLVKLTKVRNAAWDERFNHIDEHFKSGCRIEQWWCMEAKKTKEEVLKEMDRTNFDDEDEDDSPPEDEADSPSQPSGNVLDDSTRSSVDAGSDEPVPSVEDSKGKKRAASQQPEGEERRTKSGRREIMRFCCKCNDGPFPYHIHLQCIDCNHQFCRNCRSDAEYGTEYGQRMT